MTDLNRANGATPDINGNINKPGTYAPNIPTAYAGADLHQGAAAPVNMKIEFQLYVNGSDSASEIVEKDVDLRQLLDSLHVDELPAPDDLPQEGDDLVYEAEQAGLLVLPESAGFSLNTSDEYEAYYTDRHENGPEEGDPTNMLEAEFARNDAARLDINRKTMETAARAAANLVKKAFPHHVIESFDIEVSSDEETPDITSVWDENGADLFEDAILELEQNDLQNLDRYLEAFKADHDAWEDCRTAGFTRIWDDSTKEYSDMNLRWEF